MLNVSNLLRIENKLDPIRPNVGDIVQNMVHPFYEKEFLPTEVKSLANILPKPKSIYEMANAVILGDHARNSEIDQKPTLYSTVVMSHTTSVIHPSKPIGKPNIMANSAVADQFAGVPELPKGSFRSQVRVADLGDSDESGLKNLEKPVFINKGQKTVSENTVKSEEHPANPLTGKKLTNSVANAALLDAKTIKENLKKLKETERFKKLRAVQRAKSSLLKDAMNIKKSILKETNNLLGAKSAAMSLNDVLNNYQRRLSMDRTAHLKLTDRVEVKNELKTKLIAEIQGFRTRPASFKELLKVDKNMMKNVVRDIKSQLDLH